MFPSANHTPSGDTVLVRTGLASLEVHPWYAGINLSPRSSSFLLKDKVVTDFSAGMPSLDMSNMVTRKMCRIANTVIDAKVGRQSKDVLAA